MASETKVSLSRLDLVLILLAVVAGMAVWSLVQSAVDQVWEDTEPREETDQANHKVALREAEFATAQAELAACRSRLIEQRLEHQSALAILRAVGADDPRSRAATILSLRPETLQAAAQARLEKQVAARLVAALEVEAAWLESEAWLGELRAAARIGLVGPRRAVLADRQAAVQKALTEARLDRAKATARLDGIEAAYAALAQLPPGGETLLNLPADAQQAVAGAMYRVAVSERLAAAMARDHDTLSARVAKKSKAYAAAKHDAEADLADARLAWSWKKRLATFAIALPALLLLLGLANFLTVGLLSAWGLRFSGRLVLVLSVFALLILYGFQVAQFVGAVGSGLLVLLVLLWLTAPAGAQPEPSSGGNTAP
jgi:hypothetical protein